MDNNQNPLEGIIGCGCFIIAFLLFAILFGIGFSIGQGLI